MATTCSQAKRNRRKCNARFRVIFRGLMDADVSLLALVCLLVFVGCSFFHSSLHCLFVCTRVDVCCLATAATHYTRIKRERERESVSLLCIESKQKQSGSLPNSEQHHHQLQHDTQHQLQQYSQDQIRGSGSGGAYHTVCWFECIAVRS
jgi:hypothetical protein